jgi:hypothetical protein
MVREQWKELLLAEVTDSTGWQPRKVEVDYSIEKAMNVSSLCERTVNRIRNELYMNSPKNGVNWYLYSNTIINTEKLEITRTLPQVMWEESDPPITFFIENIRMYAIK